MVYEKKRAKRLPPLNRSKIRKTSQDKRDEIKNKYMELISGGMTGNSYYIGTGLNGLTQEV